MVFSVVVEHADRLDRLLATNAVTSCVNFKTHVPTRREKTADPATTAVSPCELLREMHERRQRVSLHDGHHGNYAPTIALRFVDEGRLRLDQGIPKRLSDIPQSEDITLRQLLNHTAGIPDYGNLQHYHDAVRNSPSKAWSPENFTRETYGNRLAFNPGEGWLYSNPGYMILKTILRQGERDNPLHVSVRTGPQHVRHHPKAPYFDHVTRVIACEAFGGSAHFLVGDVRESVA